MYRPSFTFWYCVFLLVIQSLGKNKEYLKNFTNGDQWSDNSTIPYELNTNSMKNQDNETELMPYNSRENSMKNKSETSFMLHELNGHSNEDDDDNIVPYKMCNNTCLWHCCNLVLNWLEKCHVTKMKDLVNNHNFTWEAAIASSCEVNDVVLHDIMENTMFYDNSSLKLSRTKKLHSSILKCAIFMHSDITKCYAFWYNIINERLSIYADIMKAIIIISLLCLLITFIVYSICPELQNNHGYTLRSYIASLFVVFTIRLTYKDHLYQEYPICVAGALLYYLCYFASLLWQNVICFDILRTFGKLCFLRKSIKQSKRKNFLISSFYVWGIASIYVIICVVMNFVPTVPDNIQPKICISKIFGFASNSAVVAYNEIPTSVLIICNICFLLFTMLNIMYTTKNIDNCLNNEENKQNKKRSMMYLKLLLFTDINLGILRIISKTTLTMAFNYYNWEVLRALPYFVLMILVTIEFLQGIVIFIIFVCKKRITQLLLKRFGCIGALKKGVFTVKSTARNHLIYIFKKLFKNIFFIITVIFVFIHLIKVYNFFHSAKEKSNWLQKQ